MQRNSLVTPPFRPAGSATTLGATPVTGTVPGARVAARRFEPAGDAHHVIVVGGPGGRTFSADDTHRMARRLPARVQHLTTCVSGSVPSDSAEPVRQGLLDRLAERPDDRALVIVMAHGDFENHRYCISLDGSTWTPCEELFKDIRSCHPGPVELFLTCCHGSEAIEFADRLPAGSVLVALGRRGAELHQEAFHRLTDHLPALAGINAFSLFLTYCTQCLGGRFFPSVHLPDGTDLHLEAALERLSGKRIEPEERHLLHAQLDRFVDPHRIDASIALIESGATIFFADLGLTLAIAGVLGGIASLATGDAGAWSDRELAGHVRAEPAQVGLDVPAGIRRKMFAERGRSTRLSVSIDSYWCFARNTVLASTWMGSVEMHYSGEPGSADFRLVSVEGSPDAIDQLVKEGILLDPAAPIQAHQPVRDGSARQARPAGQDASVGAPFLPGLYYNPMNQKM